MNDASTTIRELRELVARFVAERQWEVFHDPKNLSMALAVEAAELMEHFQWARTAELPRLVAEPETRSAVGDELADVLCFALALCNVLDLDLAACIEAKMIKNEQKYPADAFRGRYAKPS